MRILDLLIPGEGAFRHALESPRAGLWITAILIGLGALYGTWVAALQQASGADLQGIEVAEIPAYILYGGNILAGVMIALIAHVGIALIAWLMARAVGGAAHLIVLWRTTAYLLPLAALAAPWIALTTASVGTAERLAPAPVYLVLAIIGAALFLAGLHAIFRTIIGLSPFRASLAVALFLLFSTSILLIA